MAQFTSETQLMENAFPAGELQLAGRFYVVSDENGEHMIFSADSRGRLQVVLKGRDGQNELLNLSHSLGVPDERTIAALAVSQNGTNGKIHLVFAVNGKSGPDTLYVLQPMDAKIKAWRDTNLKAGLYTGTSLGTPIDDILMKNSNDFDMLRDAYGDTDRRAVQATYPQIILVTKTPDRLTEDVCSIKVDVNSATWAVQKGLTMTTNAEEIIDRAPATIGADEMVFRGMYVLYREFGDSKNPVHLRFTGFDPTAVQPTVRSWPIQVPPGARFVNAYDNGQGYTDLLIGGDKLYRVSAEAVMDGDAVPTVVDTTIDFAKVKQVFTAQDSRTLSLWTLDTSSLISYQEFDIALDGQIQPLTEVIELMQSGDYADRFAAQIDSTMTQRLFVIDRGNNVKMLEQSRQTGLWDSPTEIMIPRPTEVVTFMSYTTVVQVRDESDLPLPHQRIHMCCSAAVELLVNGITVRGSLGGAVVEADDAGSLTIVSRVDGIASPTVSLYAISKEGTLSKEPNHVIDPTGVVWDMLDNVTSAADLQNFKLEDGTPLVRSGASQKELEQAAQAIKNLRSVRNGLHNGSNEKTSKNGDQENIAHWGSFYMIKQKIGEGVKWAVERVQQGWAFIVEIGGRVWNWVLENHPQVAAALGQVLAAISDGWDKLKEKLKDKLGWTHILDVKNAMSNLATCGLVNVADALTSAGQKGSNFIEDLRDIVKSYKELRKNKMPDILQRNVRAAAAEEKEIAANGQGSDVLKATNSPAAQFGAYHVKHSEKQGDQAESNESAFFRNLIGRFKDLFTEMIMVCQGLSGKLLATLGDKNLSFDSFINEFALDAVDGLLHLLARLIKVVLDSLSDGIMLLADLVNRPIKVPVLSPLYRRLTDHELTVLDLVTLVFAIPATYVYRSVFNRAPREDQGFAKWMKPDMFKTMLGERFAKIKAEIKQREAREADQRAAPSILGTASKSTVAEPVSLSEQRASIPKSMRLPEIRPDGRFRTSPDDVLPDTTTMVRNPTPVIPVPPIKITPREIKTIDPNQDVFATLVGQLIFQDPLYYKDNSVAAKHLFEIAIDISMVLKVAIPTASAIYFSFWKWPKVTAQIKATPPSPSKFLFNVFLHVCKFLSMVALPVQKYRKLKQKPPLLEFVEAESLNIKLRYTMWQISSLTLIGALTEEIGTAATEIIVAVVQAPCLAVLHIRNVPENHAWQLALEEWLKFVGNVALSGAVITSGSDYFFLNGLSILSMAGGTALQVRRLHLMAEEHDWGSAVGPGWNSSKKSLVYSEGQLRIQEPSISANT